MSRSISADLSKTPVVVKKIKENKSNVMNTAVNVEFKSLTSEKVYTLKVFLKGKIVIAGMPSPFEQSEIYMIVSLFLRSLIKFDTKNNKDLQIDTVKTILSNYSTSVPLPENSLIDVR